MEDEFDERVACHEAGHAVMGVVLGGHIIHASIEPPDDDGPRRSGESILRWPAAVDGGLAIAEIKVSLAGPVAEMIFSGNASEISKVPEFAGDWQRATDIAAHWNSSVANKYRLLNQIEKSIWAFLEIDDHWAAVAAAADLLLAHETVEHENFEEIVNFWIGHSRFS